jgi:prevent-host-death family protein
MGRATLTTFSAKDAKARFGEVLDEALGRPVGITKHDRLTAYVVSKRDFEAMVEKLRDLEDQLWLAQADAARNGGFASAEEVDAFLSDFRKVDNNEVVNDKPGQEGVKGPSR